MRRRLCLGFLAIAAPCWVLCGCSRREAGSPLEELQRSLPVQEGVNVVVVSFDALRADALDLYGAQRGASPHLSSFAQQSIVFDNAYTVAPVTPTSFAAAFTGLLPTRVFHAWSLTYDDTLAKRFAAAGYRTAAFLNNIQLSRERNFHVGFDHYVLFESDVDDQVVRSALSWLGENRDERIFSWIHFISPHAPYDYREMAAHLYDEDYEGEFEKTTKGRFDTDDPRELERIKTLYAGEVFYADDLFGQLVAGMKQLGLLENTVVLVTSDHGEEFKEHGGLQHDRLTEEHVHVPLLLYHPAVRSEERTPVLVSNVDFLPTLLSLAGIEFAGEVDGRDLTRITSEPDWVVGVSMTGAKKRWLSLRRGRFKLIMTCLPARRQELFDLVADPQELRDLRGEKRDLVRSLRRDLNAILGGKACSVMQAAVQGADPTVGLTPENIKALKALGYLGN